MRHILITGASGAIGSAIAAAFAQHGDDLTLQYRTQSDKAQGTAQMLAARFSVRAESVYADLADTASVDAMIQTAVAQSGDIDVLVNCAGIAQQKLFGDITDADWSKMIETDLGGAFRTCRAVLPAMIRRQKGSILNISSMWGEVGASCEVHYSAAKAGLVGLTRALAKEVAPSHITVNAIAPGVIRSPMLASFSEEDLAVLADQTPLGRLGEPEDVAAAALFLTSESASFITGQILGVNGGFVI